MLLSVAFTEVKRGKVKSILFIRPIKKGKSITSINLPFSSTEVLQRLWM